MNKKYRLGRIGLAVLVCALLLMLAPAALAACVDADGVEHEHHDWGDWRVTQEPTCKENGKHVKVCNRCGKEKEEDIDALGHDWGDWVTVKDATCEESGKRVKTCKRCGKEKEEEIEKQGHKWSDWTTQQEATCDGEGKQVRSCAVCGKTEEKKLEALGHQWSDWTTQQEATCDAEGKQVRTCARCGNSEEKKLDALGHQWSDWATQQEPTCEEAGKRVRTCARCGKTEEEPLDALGHNYEATKIDPTCEEAGSTTYTCTRCGKTYTEAGEPALGHDWGEWVVTEATETSPATQTRTCKRCGLTETEELEGTEKTGAGEITLTFVLGFDTVDASVTGEAESPIDANSIPKPTHEGYTFIGWDPAVPETFPNEDTTYTAQWRANITKLDPLASVEVNTFKPSLEDALRSLPAEATVKATLFDGSTVNLKATLVWNNDSCPTYGDKAVDESGNGTYTFVPASATYADKDGNAYQINSAAVTTSCDLVIGPKTSGDYRYQLDGDNKATIVEYIGSESQALLVPAEIDGYNVISIGKGAFQGKGFAAVTLPLGLKRIGDSAFASCASLTALTVPDGVGTIGDSAFANCTKLAALVLPDTLTTIAPNATLGDVALASLTLSASCETTMSGATVYTRALLPTDDGYDATNPGKTVTVTLPMTVTDLAINSLAATPFALTTAYTVAQGHGITVAAGAGLSVNANLTNLGVITNAGTVTVASGVTLDNNDGTYTNDGATETSGKILTCAGTWSGANAKVQNKGSFAKDHDYKLVSFDHYECKVCGATRKFTKPSLTVDYKGGTLYKTYDKSTNIQATKNGTTTWLLNKKLAKSDFTVNTVTDKVTGTAYSKVSISLTGATLSKFKSADAGSYKLTLTIQLTGDDLDYYDVKKTNGKYYATISIPARIDKRTVTITPSKSGTIKDSKGNTKAYVASKSYGASDPSWFLFTQSGLLNLTEAETAAGKKLYTGKLGRVAGETPGTYKFTLGTLDFGNSNYEVKLNSEVFTITKKSISDSDIGMVTIGNQRYTGKEVKPAVTLRYGMRTLKEGTDFKVEYKDNVSPGSNTAKVKITGIGNYTGTKETTFSILNITDDFKSGSSGSGSYHYEGFDSGEFEDEKDGDKDGEGEASEDGTLVLDEENFGSVLFDRQGEAKPFVVFDDEDELAPGQRTLTIVADPMVDEVTGESVFLEDGIRERYDELHLRLDTTLVQALMQKGVTEVVYELEQADLRIPLASLVGEIPLPETAGEEADDGEPAEDEFVIEESDGVLSENGGEAEELVGEVSDFESAEVAPGTEMMKVHTYDFCIEQADATGLTESEAEVLGEGELMLPAYRVRVRVVPEGAEQVPTGLTDENGEPIAQYLAEPMPEGFYLEDLILRLQPDGNLIAAPEGAQAIYMSDEASASAPTDEAAEATDDDAEVEAFDAVVDDAEAEEFGATDSVITPVEFVESEGALVAQLPVEADGLYAVRAPEDWNPEEYLADEAGDDDPFGDEDSEEEDLEDDDFEDGFEDDGFDDEFEEI